MTQFDLIRQWAHDRNRSMTEALNHVGRPADAVPEWIELFLEWHQ